MKKLIVCLGVLATATFMTSCAGGHKNEEVVTEAQVPQAVKDAFAAKYPGATDMTWEKETEDGKVEYEIEFKLEGKEKEAFFAENGAFVKEER